VILTEASHKINIKKTTTKTYGKFTIDIFFCIDFFFFALSKKKYQMPGLQVS
jgi:hypothetical protein